MRIFLNNEYGKYGLEFQINNHAFGIYIGNVSEEHEGIKVIDLYIGRFGGYFIFMNMQIGSFWMLKIKKDIFNED